eukprot:10110208-Alexandrium_andersonii.AAC.1
MECTIRTAETYGIASGVRSLSCAETIPEAPEGCMLRCSSGALRICQGKRVIPSSRHLQSCSAQLQSGCATSRQNWTKTALPTTRAASLA